MQYYESDGDVDEVEGEDVSFRKWIVSIFYSDNYYWLSMIRYNEILKEISKVSTICLLEQAAWLIQQRFFIATTLVVVTLIISHYRGTLRVLQLIDIILLIETAVKSYVMATVRIAREVY